MSKDSPFNIGLTGVEGRILFYRKRQTPRLN